MVDHLLLFLFEYRLVLRIPPLRLLANGIIQRTYGIEAVSHLMADGGGSQYRIVVESLLVLIVDGRYQVASQYVDRVVLFIIKSISRIGRYLHPLAIVKGVF